MSSGAKSNWIFYRKWSCSHDPDDKDYEPGNCAVTPAWREKSERCHVRYRCGWLSGRRPRRSLKRKPDPGNKWSRKVGQPNR